MKACPSAGTRHACTWVLMPQVLPPPSFPNVSQPPTVRAWKSNIPSVDLSQPDALIAEDIRNACIKFGFFTSETFASHGFQDCLVPFYLCDPQASTCKFSFLVFCRLCLGNIAPTRAQRANKNCSVHCIRHQRISDHLKVNSTSLETRFTGHDILMAFLMPFKKVASSSESHRVAQPQPTFTICCSQISWGK